MMWKLFLSACLWIGTAQSQLNYEGNPLTENIDYAAEESHYLPQKNVEKFEGLIIKNDRPIDIYLEAANSMKIPENVTKYIEDRVIDIKSNHFPQNGNKVIGISNTTNTELSKDSLPIDLYENEITVKNRTKIPRQLSPDPLDSFLNSRTPEESQLALDTYLKTRQHAEQFSLTRDSQIDDNYVNKNSQNKNYLINEKKIHGLENLKSVDQGYSPGNSMIQRDEQIINSQVYQAHPLSSAWPQMAYQNRRDNLPLGPRRRPAINYMRGVPRYRNRYRAQSRIGPNFIQKPQIFHNNDQPIEVIYTKPPGLNNGALPMSNPHEDASSYFPEVDHPPVNKDVYYSQLYAQSYDPNYYKYIAKTGKIKPWLYGRLGKPEDKGFWQELYLSFKKHGMRNMMNPMFLLGLSIPALTLMLSALVSKRSFARSINDNYRMSDDEITEIAERVKRAIECYKLNYTDCKLE